MKNFKRKIARWLPWKKTAKKPTVSTKSNETVIDLSAPCSRKRLGWLAIAAFVPQHLLSFYVIRKSIQKCDTVCGDISMVQVLDLFHPKTKAYVCTAFAIKDEKGYTWTSIGSAEVNFSKPEAFFYHKAEKFRIKLKQKDDHTFYAGVSEYRDDEIWLTSIVVEKRVPPTDMDRERVIRCDKLPCPLSEIDDFLQKL